MANADSLQKSMRWYRMDLHIHTPASEDYAEKEITYLDILREADRKGLDIIAFTDHNTVAGYEALFDEVDFLERLEQRGRLQEHESEELEEYRQLLKKITVFPGFEFTSRFGSHTLAIFPAEGQASIPKIKAVLHQLGISYEKMSKGTTSVPGTQAFLEAYKIINEAGGIAIAAHINAPTGVLAIASNLPTGALRISATQSAHLHALEFTAFHSPQLQGFSSPHWYDGTNLGYERRMFCLQGSDAHRTTQAMEDDMHRWGIGDRPSEVMLPEPTFEALLALFNSQDFDRLRVPFVSDVARRNRISDLRANGPTDQWVMCPSCVDDASQVCRHVVALANSGGGAIVFGLEPDPAAPVVGLQDMQADMRAFQAAISEKIVPLPEWSVDVVNYEGHELAQIEVQGARRKPCFMHEHDERVIYVRRNGETVVASHGDIIDLLHDQMEDSQTNGELDDQVHLLCPGIEQPKSGVEVVGVTLRGDTEYFRVVDLRTSRESQVSEFTATSVWLYAIKAFQATRTSSSDFHGQVRWRGPIGLLRIYRDNEHYDQHGRAKCDLVFSSEDGKVKRVFYAAAVSWLGPSWNGLFEVEPPVADAPAALPEDAKMRWRGNMGIEALYRTPEGLFCNLVFRNRQGRDLYYRHVACDGLPAEWRSLLEVELPRSGLEVVVVHENGSGPMYKFHNLGNRHVESRLWSPDMLKEGSLRHYALRMHLDQDQVLNEEETNWLGNIGYLRRSYTAADLVYRDPDGVDHVYYGARWDDLSAEWQSLLSL